MPALQNQYNPQIAFHPGRTLADKLEELGMGPKEFAIRTGKPEKTIIAVLKGASSITPEMAVLFEQVLHIPAHFWLNKQRNYDEFLARQAYEKVLDESSTWVQCFPYKKMVELGWIAPKKSLPEQAQTLLAFFGVSTHLAWEAYYLHPKLKVSFRISLAHTKAPHAISAWLRQGELQAETVRVGTYVEKKLISSLPLLKALMVDHPQNLFQQIQQICGEAGVKVVHTPCLPQAPIHGCTRWIKDNPLIQLTGRYKRNDIFWFTFFHEIGHILLHGKKEIFLENTNYEGEDKQKENEADDFAVKWTFSKQQEQKMVDYGIFTLEDIARFAQSYQTHPAMIIGRLRYRGLVPHSYGAEFIRGVEF